MKMSPKRSIVVLFSVLVVEVLGFANLVFASQVNAEALSTNVTPTVVVFDRVASPIGKIIPEIKEKDQTSRMVISEVGPIAEEPEVEYDAWLSSPGWGCITTRAVGIPIPITRRMFFLAEGFQFRADTSVTKGTLWTAMAIFAWPPMTCLTARSLTSPLAPEQGSSMTAEAVMATWTCTCPGRPLVLHCREAAHCAAFSVFINL